MSRLEELRKKFNELQSTIDLDLSLWNPKTVKSMETQQELATKAQPGVLFELTREIANNSLTIKITESVNNRTDLIDDLKNKQGDNVIAIDFFGLEKRFLKECAVNVKNEHYELNMEFLHKINKEIYFVMRDLAIQSLPVFVPKGSDVTQANSLTEAQSKLSTLLVNTYGVELKNYYINFELMNAVKTKSQYDKVIILLTNVPDSQVNSTAVSNRSIVISSNPVEGAILVNSDTTTESLLKSIKNKVKKN